MEKFKVIRQALEEHLSAINENTSEIQALFDYLNEMDIKIEKVVSRLDNLQLNEDKKEKFFVAPLNQMEKEIFLVLYTEEIPLSYPEIAEKSKLPLHLIPEVISALVNKGIPFQRSLVKNQLFLRLDPVFKELQAKENLVNLSLASFME